MGLKINTIPPKRLAETIESSATSFKLNDILGFDGVALTPTIVGDVVYGSFQDSSGTILELFKIDPSTIASGSISFIKRGIQFNEDGSETEVSGNKLLWIKNQTIVNLGTNVPAVFKQFSDKVSDETIAGVKTYSSIPVLPASDPSTGNQATRKTYVDDLVSTTAAGLQTNIDGKVNNTGDETVAGIKTFSSFPVTPSSAPSADYQAANKKYVDDTAFAGAPNASTTVKGIVEIATQTEVNNGTDTGGTGATLAVIPSTFQSGVSTIVNNAFQCGDGSDGTVTLDGTNTYSTFLSKSGSTYTMLRDMYATTLTVNSGVTLVTSGFIIFASVEAKGAGTITWGTASSGSAGTAGNSGVSAGTGGAGGTASSTGRLRNVAGGAGANGVNSGSSSAGNASSAGSAVTSGIGVAGATGGNGGAGGGSGGSAGTPSTPSYVTKPGVMSWNTMYGLDIGLTGTLVPYLAAGQSTGGGSGGVNNTASGGGGGAGASGGVVIITAKLWSGTFTIQSTGGAGGNGAGSNAGVYGGSGGGAGGAGGTALVIYGSKTWTGSYVLTGGAGGTGSSGGGGGSSGSNGAAGTTGNSIEIALSSLTR